MGSVEVFEDTFDWNRLFLKRVFAQTRLAPKLPGKSWAAGVLRDHSGH